MSRKRKSKVNETEEMNQNDQAQQAADQQNTAAAEDKPEKVGFGTKIKNFGKEKVVPAAKLVGKGVAKGASIAGGALATAYLIGMAIGGYTAIKGKTDEESKDQEQSSSEESAAEKPAEDQKTDDVQISLNENNVQVDSNIE